MIEGCDGASTVPAQKYLSLVNEIEGLSSLIRGARRIAERIGSPNAESLKAASPPDTTPPSLLKLLESGPGEILDARRQVEEALNEIETMLFG